MIERGDGKTVALQLDATLATVGFKCSTGLLEYLLECEPQGVERASQVILTAVRELVGDHVEHNVYFRDFPRNVPDTMEFWLRCIQEAMDDPSHPVHMQQMMGYVNLLDLPSYGHYLHSYSDMLQAHETLIHSVGDRVTILHLGSTLRVETAALYRSLAGSSVPAAEADLGLLYDLAHECLDVELESIPVRENRAVINVVRLRNGRPLLCDTVTDVLRVACLASGGDVTLQIPTRLRSFSRPHRRVLLVNLNRIVSENHHKLGDVHQYREQWKRLGERLHPHEFSVPFAHEVFATARREVDEPQLSFASLVEHAFASEDHKGAALVLESSPGLQMRSMDRLLRTARPEELDAITASVIRSVSKASGRVLLSLREHLVNRTKTTHLRVFPNRKGRAWTTEDPRSPLDQTLVSTITSVLDMEISRRLPTYEHVVVDPAVLGLALPLSNKSTADGFGVMPRGSITPVEGNLLRFFTYWRETENRTDFDLSVVMLDDSFHSTGHLSWTNLRGYGGCHSGDITGAHNGASEFIDLDLSKVDAKYIVPQLLVYSGEHFDQVAESMFGFMTRDGQKGKPFEPRTVRMRSDVRGRGRVALPVVFVHTKSGWVAKWMHLYLRGNPSFNVIEETHRSASLLVRGIVERHYTTVGEYLDLAREAMKINEYEVYSTSTTPVTYIGIDAPDALPAGSDIYTLGRLHELVVK